MSYSSGAVSTACNYSVCGGCQRVCAVVGGFVLSRAGALVVREERW